MKLRKVGKNLITSFLLLLATAILLTSAPLAMVAIFPLLLLLIPVIPFSVHIEEFVNSETVRVGEEMNVEATLRVLGFGIVKVMHSLPESFELSKGVNVAAAFVVGRSRIKLSYSCIPLKRGNYDVGRFVIETENILATTAFAREVRVKREVEVRARVYQVRRVELRRGIAKRPLPELDVSQMGTPGTDFREIRKYIPGDPLRFVNWKATAKLNQLMVNEFEREGRKAIWIFLDANPYMKHGTVLRSCYDAASELAASICYYFAVRGYKVGLYVVGHGILLYPDSGRRQFRKTVKLLSRLDVSSKREDFLRAVESSKKYIEVLKPASIFITRVEQSRPLKAALKAMSGTKRLPVIVITLKSYEDYSVASQIVQIMRRQTISSLRNAGVDVIELEMEMKPEKIIPVVAG